MIVLDYIKKERWFQGNRREDSLLMFSIRVKGQRDLMKSSYKFDFVECLLCPTKKNFLIRVINLNQAKEFHAYSLKKLKEDENIIQHFLDKDKLLWKNIADLSKDLKKVCNNNEKEKAKRIFINICEKYKECGMHFFIIFSLGMKMTESGISNQLLKNHDQWRNSIAFKEEKLGEAIWRFLDFYFKGIKPLDIMKYLSYEELLKSFNDTKKIKSIIKKRKKDDYLFLGMRKHSQVIDDVKIIREVGKYFSNLFESKYLNDLIEGRVTYKSDELIQGEVVLVKDKTYLKGSYKDKILVAVQTTPHFVPYLDGVKAIITDEGGVTSHAAIISREFKIPAVVGTQIATKVLKTGDIVEITFKEGKVRKLDKKK